MSTNVTSLILTDLTSQLFLSQLFDTWPDSVLWMRAIYDQHGQYGGEPIASVELPQNQLVDFVIDYANPKARQTPATGYQFNEPTSIRYGNLFQATLAEKTFQHLCEVFTTGKTVEFDYDDPNLGQRFSVTRSKAGDGILSITRLITDAKELMPKDGRQRTLLDGMPNQAPDFAVTRVAIETSSSNVAQPQQATVKTAASLQAIIDIAQTGIFVISPVNNKKGELVDFRFRIVNRTVAALVGQTPDVLQGTLFSDWFTSYRNTPIFAHFQQVLETGEEKQFEINYNVDGFDDWFDVKAVKFENDILITFTSYTELKRAQKMLEQTVIEAERQADLLNSVLDSSNSGVIAFKAIRDEAQTIVDFHFLVANQTATAMLSMKMEEMVGKKLLTIFPGNIESGLFDLYIKTTETGEPGRTEVYYNHDGLDFWLDISSQKLEDGFVVTFTDVSETKRAALLIEQSADEMRTVIDSAQVAIFLITPVFNEVGKLIDFRFRTANQMIASYVGQEPDALTGQLVSRWFPDYRTNGLFSRYVTIFETGRTQHFNFHFETDTVDSWENYTVLKVGNDILVTFSDFTELKKLQQRLEASTTELQTVIDTCQTGIFLFSPVRDQTGQIVDFRFRLANRQLASYVGQDANVVVGALGSTWFPDYKTNGLFKRYHETYVTGESQRFDFHYNGDGVDAWLDIMTTKSGDDVLVTFGDYTPLKQLQQQLENSVIDLQRSNKNLEQFAYIASHDLQEPLRKIQAFGDIVQSQFASVIGEDGADMIARMQSAAARMQILIKDVLAYSRVANKRENVTPVDLNRLVRDVLSDIETAITEKNAIVKVESLPTVRGDAAQLRQLIQNLVSNALKFTKADKTADPPIIQLTYRRILGRDVTGVSLPNTDDNRSFHLIEVSDNGIGFDPHQAERIFQVFQRLHSRSEYQGTGIGLAIVQKVVDNHHGYILAEGRPGQGATFRVLLPL